MSWVSRLIDIKVSVRAQLARIAVCVVLTTSGCATMNQPPIQTVDKVNISEFMGSWYIIASIPTVFEKHAYNAVESYVLNQNGTIKTTFTYHKGAFEGSVKTMHATGYIRNSSNAEWGMQFLWPFRQEYLIAYLDAGYTQAIIARSARDHLWIMARKPRVSDAEYDLLANRASAMGYDVSKIQRVPQQWP